MEDEEYDLSSPPRLNASTPSPLLAYPATSPVQLPKAQESPISKRRGTRRSSQACMVCRLRKVRCNVVAHGAPCSNCRHDEVDCILPLSRRRKSARKIADRKQREQSIPNSIYSPDFRECRNRSVDTNSACQQHQHQHQLARAKGRLLERAHSSRVRKVVPRSIALSEYPPAENLSNSGIIPSPNQTVPSAPTSFLTQSWIDIQAPLASAPSSKHPSSLLPTLPRVFASFSRHLDTIDLTYLDSRDALTVPSEFFQIPLLKAYVEFVHPNTPVLDLETFLSIIKNGFGGRECERGRDIGRENCGISHIPLLLFQAVMFAAVRIVGMEVLREAGYETREIAKRAFFWRVRLLYDFDTCGDRLSIIQSLLLMTLSEVPSSPDGKDAWYWLGLAISLSYSLRLNRSDLHQNKNLRRRRLERRVWWTIFIRDRTLALNAETGFVKSVRIKREDCDIEALCLEDFNLDYKYEQQDDGIDDVRIRQNAMAFVEKAILSWCSNDVLLSNFSATGTQLSTPALFSSQHVYIPQARSHETRHISLPLHTSIWPNLQGSIFESQEGPNNHIGVRSSPSLHEDCMTPQEGEEFVLGNFDEKPVYCMAFGPGFEVDSECDDLAYC